jgi:spore germination protein GerM
MGEFARGAVPRIEALLLSGCIADPDPAVTSANSPTSSSRRAAGTDGVPTTSAPLETTQSSNKAPVYWIGRSNSNVFLYREFRDVPDDENPITRALRAMMSETPLDPDFFTPWQNPKNLATSISGTNVITVDVSADAFNSNLDADMAQRAIQQLVYTATAAGASSGLIDSGQQIEVVILVDGHTDYLAFKHVKLGAPTSRSAGMVAPVWIIDPQQGTEVSGRTGQDRRTKHRPQRQTPLANPQGPGQRRQGKLSDRGSRGRSGSRRLRGLRHHGQPRARQLRGSRLPDRPG